MGRLAYLDCFAGASGDMILGALLDAGVSIGRLKEELGKLSIKGYRLEAATVRRAGIAATQVSVTVHEPQPARTLAEVAAIIKGGKLEPADAEKALKVYQRLAAAEAAVHGEPVEQAHLHDVGAVDAIVDIAGAVIGLRLLGVEELYSSPLPVGKGSVKTAHGLLPVPAPATLALLTQAKAPLVAGEYGNGEMLTPTGAAIITTLARFGRPALTIEAVGYGAGGRDPSEYPNVLRLWVGEEPAATDIPPGAEKTSTLSLLETNVDDTTPEVLGYVQERLLAAGALDAWFTPIQMKKGRPAAMLSALCPPEKEAALAGEMLRETSTLGVRVHTVLRHEARRETLEFESSLGPVRVKVKYLPGRPPHPSPEYDDCRRIARESGIPLIEVYRTVQAEAEERLSSL